MILRGALVALALKALDEHWPFKKRVDIWMTFAPLVPADQVVLCNDAAGAGYR